MRMVRSLLLGSAAGVVAVAGAQAADMPVKAKPVEYVKICSLYGDGFFYLPGTQTCIRLGGNVQSERGDPGTWVYDLAGNTWKQLRLDVQPPPRANSRLAYDPAAKKIVLFGGDQLDQLLADTWAFDVTTQKWEEKKPASSPSPRAC